MDKKDRFTFEELFKQNENRIHYHIHKLHLNDPHQEFYQEGLFAMWNAYKTYQPDKGPLATYFNYTIKHRMIDLMRKKNREEEKKKQSVQLQRPSQGDGNYHRVGGVSYPLITAEDPVDYSTEFWDKVKSKLTANQWKWVKYRIIEEMHIKEIAEQEGVSIDAVKSWGREVRRKLKAGMDDGNDENS